MNGDDNAQLTGLSRDMSALKSDSSEVKEGLKKIYDVLTRLAVLEDNREHTENSLGNLYQLYHDLKEKVAGIDASIAAISTGVKGNNQASGWIIHVGVALGTAILTLLIKSKF